MHARVAFGGSQDVFVDDAQLFDRDSPDAAIDPAGLPVDVAFVPEADAREPLEGEWRTDCIVIVRAAPVPGMPAPLPRVLVPAVTPAVDGLARGRYTAWARCRAVDVPGGQTAPLGPVGILEVF